MLIAAGIFIVSLAVLLVGSDWFVDSAEKIGLSFGISPFIIGVTIVAFGTSLPELATSLIGVHNGMSEIVIGNVVGSNITNILLVLGMTAMFAKHIRLDFDIMDQDMPLLFGSAFMLYFAVSDQHFSKLEALLFIGGIAAFVFNSIKSSLDEENEKVSAGGLDYIKLIIGAAMVYLGARYTIQAVEQISTNFSISPDLIALTVIALGTSLPELVVSITAARKGKNAMAVGNVLGSNMFNTFAVMGIPGLIADLTIPADIMSFSLPFMVAVTILFGMITISKKISFWEGSMMVAFYVFFLGTLIESIG